MSSTIEVIDNYSNVCLSDITDESSPSRSLSDNVSDNDNVIQNGSVNVVDEPKVDADKDVFSDTRDISFIGFSTSSSNESSSIIDKVDIGIGADFSFNLVFEKLAELDTLLKTEKDQNIILQNKLNNLEIKYNKEFSYLNNDITELFDGLNNVDLKVLQLDQYTRRESLVISGIDDNISQDHLEFTVLTILRSIGLYNVSSYEISACHRLFNKNTNFPARTIIRFTNRKIVEFCLRNRDKLKECRHELRMNLRFYEHLTECNESVLKECFQLAKYDIIDSYYIRNGFVKIVVKAGDRPIKIYHTITLHDMFKNFYDHHNLDFMP